MISVVITLSNYTKWQIAAGWNLNHHPDLTKKLCIFLSPALQTSTFSRAVCVSKIQLFPEIFWDFNWIKEQGQRFHHLMIRHQAVS